MSPDERTTHTVEQLDAFGAGKRQAERAPDLYCMAWCGLPLPPSPEAQRQIEMLTRERRLARATPPGDDRR